MPNYFLRRRNKTLGPFDLAKVKKGIAAGQILSSDSIATSANGPWQLVSDVSALQGPVGQPGAGGPSTVAYPSQVAAPSPRASMPQSAAQAMEFRAESEYAAVVHGPYDVVYQLMRDAMTNAKGKIKTDSASQGSLLAKWRYGINPFGLSVSAVMRDAGNGWTRVEVKGFFSDAVDTFRHAKKKARLVLDQFRTLVESQSSVAPATSHAVPASRPGPSAPSAQSAGSGKSYSGMATASMICGIGGLVICGIAGLVGVILGIIALSGMSSSGNDAGRGSAITGIVLGGIAMVLWSLIILANM